MSEKRLVGTVSHYFGKIRVAGILVSGQLAVGDRVFIIGHTTALGPNRKGAVAQRPVFQPKMEAGDTT